MSQLILVQGGEFIACEDIIYTPAPTEVASSLLATALLPINTMRPVAVRLDNELIPLPALRSQDRKVISRRVRVDGPLATRIARALNLVTPTAPVVPALPPA